MKNNFPKITIGIVLYKGEKYLPHSIPSLLNQDYPGEIEYLFRDHSPNAEAKKFLLKKKIPLQNKTKQENQNSKLEASPLLGGIKGGKKDEEKLKRTLGDPSTHSPKSPNRNSGWGDIEIEHHPNQNHSEGHNALIQKMTGEYYFCGSFDAIYQKNFLRKFVQKLEENPDYGFATPKLLQWNFPPFQGGSRGVKSKKINIQKTKTHSLDSCGLQIFLSHECHDIGQGEEDYGQYDFQERIFGASGAAILFRKSSLEKIALLQCESPLKKEYFDELLHYKNDIDLCYRLNWAGEKCIFASKAIAWHDRGLHQKTKKSKTMKEDSFFGHLAFIYKNFSNQFPFFIKFSTKIQSIIRNTFAYLFTPKSIIKFWRYEKELKRKRRKIKKEKLKNITPLFFQDPKKIPENPFLSPVDKGGLGDFSEKPASFSQLDKYKKNETREFKKQDTPLPFETKISLIIVNYHKAKEVEKNIEGILKQKFSAFQGVKNFEILLIDNSEKREESEKIKSIAEKYPNIKIFISPKNLGYPKANNIAAKNATGEILFFINPDITWTDKNTLQKITDALEKNPDIGIIGPKQISETTKKTEISARAFPNIFLQIIRRTPLRNAPIIKKEIEKDEMQDLLTPELSRGLTNREVDWLQSSFIAMQKKDFENFGMFNENYFLFMADAELCLNAWKQKKKVIYYTNTTIHSDGIRCSAGGIFDFFKKKTLRIHLKDALKYFWKHFFEKNPRTQNIKQESLPPCEEKIIFSTIKSENEIDTLKNKFSKYKNFVYQYNQETIEFLKKNFHKKNSLYLLAKKGKNFTGFCALDDEWWEDNFFFLREIFIEPEYQQQKIGEKFFEKCINHAKEKNMKGIVTQTDFKNIPMQKICEKFGLKKWNNPEWNDGITYKLLF